MNTISFKTIKDLFDMDQWDIGYLSEESMLRCALSPIKYKFNQKHDANLVNDVHFKKITNAVVLLKVGHTYDYTHYEEAENILSASGLANWYTIYTNFKEAAILSGLGVRAKNSLVYNYKFGFDHHITVVGFNDTIVDTPTDKRVNTKYWSRCQGCDDCARACPAGAIHNKEEPYWLNSTACSNFIQYSNHPTIPSIKQYWHKNVYPELPKELVDSIVDQWDLDKLGDLIKDNPSNLPWNRNGHTFDDQRVVKKDGKFVHLPMCRECTSQPRCSKWGGKYPYEVPGQDVEIKRIHFSKK